MECVLFRHGIAVDREDWSRTESERPLTAKGLERTAEAASGLRWLDLEVTHLLSSPLVRAVETAKVIRESVRVAGEIQVRDELLPEAPPDILPTLLSGFPPEACVICVGHEPHLSAAAGVLLFGKPVDSFTLKKAGACCIVFATAPKAGAGVLRWWLTPAQLRRLGRKG